MLKSHFPYAAAAFVLAALFAGNGALFVITIAATLALIPVVYATDDENTAQPLPRRAEAQSRTDRTRRPER